VVSAIADGVPPYEPGDVPADFGDRDPPAVRRIVQAGKLVPVLLFPLPVVKSEQHFAVGGTAVALEGRAERLDRQVDQRGKVRVDEWSDTHGMPSLSREQVKTRHPPVTGPTTRHADGVPSARTPRGEEFHDRMIP
jgi:hypothetical protein